MTNLINHLKYRWKNCRAPLPGELEPTKAGVSVIYASETPEREPVRLFRRLRALLLGYGPGWTFGEAVLHWGWSVLGPIVYWAIVAFLLRRMLNGP